MEWYMHAYLKLINQTDMAQQAIPWLQCFSSNKKINV